MLPHCNNMANNQKRTDKELGRRTAVAAEARGLVRRGMKASLATLDSGTGHPIASLVTVATEPGGSPLILISTLANHTRNLAADPRASILFDGTGGPGDLLEGSRVSVYGRLEKTGAGGARARFLARHPSAEMYADFADFGFYRMHIEGAHFVGGFGRIHDFTPGELTIDVIGAETLLEAEPEIVAHMNADHADVVEFYATRLLDGPPGRWRFTGCDPEGCDLVLDDKALRLVFADRVTSPQAIRKCLADLARQARR